MKYTADQLSAIIAAASDAAENKSSADIDIHYDVREKRGHLYIQLREHADGGRVVWSTATSGPSNDPYKDAMAIVQAEAERAELSAV